MSDFDDSHSGSLRQRDELLEILDFDSSDISLDFANLGAGKLSDDESPSGSRIIEPVAGASYGSEVQLQLDNLWPNNSFTELDQYLFDDPQNLTEHDIIGFPVPPVDNHSQSSFPPDIPDLSSSHFNGPSSILIHCLPSESTPVSIKAMFVLLAEAPDCSILPRDKVPVQYSDFCSAICHFPNSANALEAKACLHGKPNPTRTAIMQVELIDNSLYYYSPQSKETPLDDAKRHKFSTDDLSYLETFYATNSKPSRKQRQEIAIHVAAKEKQIKIWFNNARQRKKTDPSSNPAVKVLPTVPASLPLSSEQSQKMPQQRAISSPLLERTLLNQPRGNGGSDIQTTRHTSSQICSKISNSTMSPQLSSATPSTLVNHHIDETIITPSLTDNVSIPTSAHKSRHNYPCTCCKESNIFSDKYQWKRHETTIHEPKEVWICCDTYIVPEQTNNGLENVCIFCTHTNPDQDHLNQIHNYNKCVRRPTEKRKYHRLDQLKQHLQDFHKCSINDVNQHMFSKWRKEVDQTGKHWVCGICQQTFISWPERQEHIGGHWDDGLDMSSWKLGTGVPAPSPAYAPSSSSSSPNFSIGKSQKIPYGDPGGSSSSTGNPFSRSAPPDPNYFNQSSHPNGHPSGKMISYDQDFPGKSSSDSNDPSCTIVQQQCLPPGSYTPSKSNTTSLLTDHPPPDLRLEFEKKAEMEIAAVKEKFANLQKDVEKLKSEAEKWKRFMAEKEAAESEAAAEANIRAETERKKQELQKTANAKMTEPMKWKAVARGHKTPLPEHYNKIAEDHKTEGKNVADQAEATTTKKIFSLHRMAPKKSLLDKEKTDKKADAINSSPPPPPPLFEEKKPIKFRDAVGRKFSFPFHLCATRQGLEKLIKEAFLYVEVIGPHVAQGHYDLIGPNGRVILPQMWETMIEPNLAISMRMWPMPESSKALIHFNLNTGRIPPAFSFVRSANEARSLTVPPWIFTRTTPLPRPIVSPIRPLKESTMQKTNSKLVEFSRPANALEKSV